MENPNQLKKKLSVKIKSTYLHRRSNIVLKKSESIRTEGRHQISPNVVFTKELLESKMLFLPNKF